ncbi:immunity 49 family protein [Nocardiopsis alborubida]|nr:immunity 49 family protein [Nocardiopsis alborubida]
MDVMFSTAADPGVERLESWQAWTTDMQMYHALFAVETNPPGADLELMVHHKIRRPKATGPSYAASASNWTTAFFLAVICRDQKRYRELCEISVDLLREAGESEGAQYNPFTYHWISALQAFVLNRPGLGEELLAAMELSTPDRVDFGDTELLDKLVFPPMNAFLRLVERDSDKFNEALAQGVALHADYYTANESRANDIEGVVPLGLLAMACLAYDTAESDPDFHLDVESGYLPKRLVERNWYGEFPI